MTSESPFNRIVLVVLDSVGIGEMPDAADYGDSGADTLGHALGSREVHIPNLRQMGLANIRRLPVDPVENPNGVFGKAATSSRGKDTTTGHWEMSGIITERPFPTYSNGFPQRVIEPFDHRSLQDDVSAFRETVATTENLCVEIFQRLKSFPAAKLEAVRVVETSNNSFEYAGD